MRRSGTAPLIVMLLAALALMVATGSAAAHPATKAAPTSAPDIEVVVPGPSAPAPSPSEPPDSTDTPPLAAAGALALGALVATARRWPRRVLVVSFILLLTVFAFENALHSVHHGFDAQQTAECAVAALSAHLAAVPVDGVVGAAFILAIARTPVELDLSSPAFRLLGSDQVRAPPLPAG